jgi:hypothetical protein
VDLRRLTECFASHVNSTGRLSKLKSTLSIVKLTFESSPTTFDAPYYSAPQHLISQLNHRHIHINDYNIAQHSQGMLDTSTFQITLTLTL